MSQNARSMRKGTFVCCVRSAWTVRGTQGHSVNVWWLNDSPPLCLIANLLPHSLGKPTPRAQQLRRVLQQWLPFLSAPHTLGSALGPLPVPPHSALTTMLGGGHGVFISQRGKLRLREGRRQTHRHPAGGAGIQTRPFPSHLVHSIAVLHRLLNRWQPHTLLSLLGQLRHRVGGRPRRVEVQRKTCASLRKATVTGRSGSQSHECRESWAWRREADPACSPGALQQQGSRGHCDMSIPPALVRFWSAVLTSFWYSPVGKSMEPRGSGPIAALFTHVSAFCPYYVFLQHLSHSGVQFVYEWLFLSILPTPQPRG